MIWHGEGVGKSGMALGTWSFSTSGGESFFDTRQRRHKITLATRGISITVLRILFLTALNSDATYPM